jgi:hypothetical protein
MVRLRLALERLAGPPHYACANHATLAGSGIERPQTGGPSEALWSLAPDVPDLRHLVAQGLAAGVPGLASGASGAHSQAMEYISSKTVDFLIAVCTASAIAFTAGLAAHYVFGASVQTSASIGAGLFALLLSIGWFLQ